MVLIFEYILVAAIVVYLSIKASEYIDMLDKTTGLSGAFLGGVLLSAVTSLPELFTSISATVLLNKPSLCIGNILGSNLFNVAILALLGIVAIRGFRRAAVAKGNIAVTHFVLLIYGVLILNRFNIIDFEIVTLNIVTFVIIVLYALGVRYLSGENDSTVENYDKTIPLTTRQIAVRFAAVSVGIISSSILMTYITDDLAMEYNIGMGLAGAIFLGVATSLPEVSSTVALFRMKNYNVAVGNIIGSNLFNFVILCVADLLCIGSNVYDYSDPKVENLLIFGCVATLAMLPALRTKNTAVKVLCLAIVVACYAAFLLVD